VHVEARPEPPRPAGTADPHHDTLVRARRAIALAAAVTLAAGLLAAAAGRDERPRPAGPARRAPAAAAPAPRPPAPAAQPARPAAPGPPFVAPPPKPRVYVLTDSVMIGAHEAMRRVLGDRYDLFLAGWVGLSLPAGIQVLRDTRSEVGDVAVVQLGNNYGGNPVAFGHQIDELMGVLAGVDEVIWLNVQEFSPRQHEVNVELAAARERWANLRIADWFAVAGSTPGLVGGQAGIHLTGRGAVAAAELIGRELDAWLASRRPPPGAWAALDVRFRGGLYVAAGRAGPERAPRVVVGAGPGAGPQVSLFWPDGRPAGGFFPFPEGFRGGVRVAVCDTDGDGTDEIVAGAGPSGAPVVAVHRADGRRLAAWLAYDAAFAGGVSVGCGDLDGDGSAEIVTGPGAGGGPDVRVFSATGRYRGSFWAYDRAFTGGVNVAVGDLDGDGSAEIVTGPGDGGGADVRGFDAHGREVRPAALAFDGPTGARVAVLPAGGGRGVVVAAPGRRGRPWVRPLA
jgi:hypothetical protein